MALVLPMDVLALQGLVFVVIIRLIIRHFKIGGMTIVMVLEMQLFD